MTGSATSWEDTPAVPRTKLYYRGSGRFSLRHTVIALLISGAACAILAYFTAHLQVQITANSVAIALTGAFALAVGAVTGSLLRYGRVRSRLVIVVGALLVAWVALYLHWTVWSYVVTHPFDSWSEATASELRNFLHPTTLIRRMVAAAKVCGQPESSILLRVTWVVEALVVAGIAVMASLTARIANPFCERCGRWCDASAGIIETAPCHPGELRNRLEGRDFDFLLKLGPPTQGPRTFFRFDLYGCRCGATHALSARMIPVISRSKEPRDAAIALGGLVVLDKLLLTPGEARRFEEARPAPRR